MKYRLEKGAILFVFVLLGVALLSETSVAATNGWKNGYYYVNGKKQKSKWIEDGRKTYYVDNKGKKLKGWHKLKGSYYFFNDKNKNGSPSKSAGMKLTKLSSQVLTMGIDVSEWQGRINWQKVKDSGVRFVMIRLGYGKGRYGSKNCTMDKRFQDYVKGAGEVGIPIGIYFYSYATTPLQAQREAEFTIENLQGIPVSFPIAYDIEDAYILKKTTKKTRTQMVQTFMDTVAAAGYYPVYYCNQTWYTTYLDSSGLKDYDFWYARYTYIEPSREDYPYTMWQASSTQKMDGITQNTVDVDFLYEDYFHKINERTQAMKYGWHDEGGKRRYYYQGKPKQSGWLSIAGQTYYFREGEPVTGWKTIDSNRYYFNGAGEMQTDFVKISGKYYLFDEQGILQMTTDKPGVTIDGDGVCHIKKGWYKDSKGKYFYRLSNGKVAKNAWVTTGKKTYYVNSSGHRVTGFKTIKGKKYYFQENGEMVKGKTIKIKGKKYKFDKKGVLKK